MTDNQKEQIYRDYHRKVFGYLRSRLPNVQDAEDLASEVFVKVFEKIDCFDESRASLSTWIYTITRNTLTDHFRTQKQVEEIPEALTDGSSLEEDVCNTETLETLAKALKALDTRERDIVILRFYSGKTLKDIAAQMGISYAYAKVLQSRALGSLKKVFSEQ